jgi:competence protein ComEA
VEYPININSADIALLDELPGVGPATAQAIVTYRDQHGPFASVNGLEDVPGIGPAKVAALQGLVTT